MSHVTAKKKINFFSLFLFVPTVITDTKPSVVGFVVQDNINFIIVNKIKGFSK